MKTMLLYLLAVAGLCTAAATAAPIAAIDSPMVYRYWDWSITKSRDDYQVAALTLALEKTRASHGSYEVIRVKQPLSSSRALREIQTGEIINLHAAPALVRDNTLTPVTEDVSLAIEIPLMGGLLGYRQLIVRKDKLEQFQQITDPEQLKTLVAGQGRNWEDVYIYRHNGYPINDDGDYLALVHMLIAQRFDYLPMSFIEVKNVLTQAETPEQLAIVDNLLLYYPLPVYFYVSKKYPQLAERLEKGLQIARDDGSLDRLLNDHFAEKINLLKKRNLKLLILENPSVPESMGLNNPPFLKASR